jgi:hypothetical protein
LFSETYSWSSQYLSREIASLSAGFLTYSATSATDVSAAQHWAQQQPLLSAWQLFAGHAIDQSSYDGSASCDPKVTIASHEGNGLLSEWSRSADARDVLSASVAAEKKSHLR